MDKIKVSRLTKDLNLNLIVNACKITYIKDFDFMEEHNEGSPINFDLLHNLLKMEHTGLFEHVSLSYYIEGASRSLLAQITRHRLFSFTSASQHYIDYSAENSKNMFVVPSDCVDEEYFLQGCNESFEKYTQAIKNGEKPEVARGLLPNAFRNNLVMTGNLRQWLSFLELRCCSRNTTEIEMIADIIREDIITHFPKNMHKYFGPYCTKHKACNQGHKTCGVIKNYGNK